MTDKEHYGMFFCSGQLIVHCLILWIKQIPVLLYSNYPFAGFKDFLSSLNFGTFFFESDAHCLLLEFSNTSGT